MHSISAGGNIMLKKVSTALILVLSCGGFAFAQLPQAVIGAGLGAPFKAAYFQPSGTVRTLSADTAYILTGIYYVDSLAVLNIPPGTVILGDSATGATLCIKRGGKIHANGTANQPIVFTTRNAPGDRRVGQWGGVILLGSARNNQGLNTVIEGGLHPSAVYGGNDDNDSSGVMRYVRIEYGGIPFLTDNEVNGLTMGSVGRRTVIEYIQTSFNNDDGFEWFGGTVNARYLVSWRNLDDDFDSDFGWSGRVQFGYALRDPAIFDASTGSNSNGFETDNMGGSSGPWPNRPTTTGVFSNITAIGPLSDTSQYTGVSPKHDYAVFIRRRSSISIFNSVLAGFRHGIVLRNDSTQWNASVDSLQIRNVSLQTGRRTVGVDTPPSSFSGVGFNGFDAIAWYTTAGWSNLGVTPRQPAAVGLSASAFAFGPSNDPRPALGSEPATAGTNFSYPKLAGFTPTTYRGAFDPALPMSQQWTAGWTNFDPQWTDYLTSVHEIGNSVPEQFELQQNYPNPFNPSTTIRFSIPVADFYTLKVYNMLGQEVGTLVNQQLPAGTYEAQFGNPDMASGAYMYRLSGNGQTQIRRMIMVK
jgi:hypothetical protein